MNLQQQPNELPAQNESNFPFWRRPVAILLLILLLAASLRLVNLGQSPPGLNQDEATNAWNAYCLLKTGKDQVGTPWPIFYAHAIGCNRTTLGIYLLMPLQAIAGLNIYTIRLTAAIAGICTVLLTYFVAKRLFNQQIGLVAAAFLAFNPWHLHLSRWAIEGGFCPLLSIAPIALLLWANMPIGDDTTRTPRPVLAALAGALTGICCYGHWVMLLFIPPLIFFAVLVNLPAWWRTLKTRNGALAVAAFFFTFALTFGPLAWQYMFRPKDIARHAHYLQDWVGSSPLSLSIRNVPIRYLQHFGLDFLFIKGDLSSMLSLPDAGPYLWYALPLMLLGLIPLFGKLKSSASARLLLVLIVLYPIGDSLHWGVALHALRSSPGLISLILLSALGAVSTAAWLRKRNRILASAIIAAFLLTAIGMTARYLYHYYGEYNRRTETYHAFHVDLVKACQWLRPRFDQFDAVFCTVDGMNMPYMISLVAMGYDPSQWFKDPHDFFADGEYEFCTSYGKMHFIYSQASLEALNKLPRRDRVLFIVRPGEIRGLKDPILQIRRADGIPTLWLCQP